MITSSKPTDWTRSPTHGSLWDNVCIVGQDETGMFVKLSGDGNTMLGGGTAGGASVHRNDASSQRWVEQTLHSTVENLDLLVRARSGGISQDGKRVAFGTWWWDSGNLRDVRVFDL